jgi:NADH:ubiquinone oxidoreductase subunit 4 (subunit M)
MAGPTPVSALIHAATMVTAGVYLMVRMSPVLVGLGPGDDPDRLDRGAHRAAGGAHRDAPGRHQEGAGVLHRLPARLHVHRCRGRRLPGGIFHLVTHAFFKGLLFLAAGSVMHAMANRTDIWRMGGLRRAMPITFWTSLTGWLAISGVPPFAGFFSKDQILNEAYLHGYGAIYVIGILVAVLTAFYMSRWFFLIFLGEPRFGRELHPHESPRSMTVPLLVLAVASTIGGMVLNPVHRGWLYNTSSRPSETIADIGYAPAGPLQRARAHADRDRRGAFGHRRRLPVLRPRDVSVGELAEPIRGPIADLERTRSTSTPLYESVFVRFGGALARGLAWVDANVVDGLVQRRRRGRGRGRTHVPRGPDRPRALVCRRLPRWCAGAGRGRPGPGEVADGDDHAHGRAAGLIGAVALAFIGDDRRSVKAVALTSSLAAFVVAGAARQFDPADPNLQLAERFTWIPSDRGGARPRGRRCQPRADRAHHVPDPADPDRLLGSGHRHHAYAAAFLVLQAAVVGVFAATDLLLFYIFFEFTLVPLYLLIGIWGGAERKAAAVKFFLYTLLGGLLMLVAILYLYVQAGSFEYEDALALELSLAEQRWLFVAFVAAFGVKVPVFPVHTWLPDAHTEAPTGGSVFLAGILLKMGTFGLLRYALPLFPDATIEFAPWLLGIAVSGSSTARSSR